MSDFTKTLIVDAAGSGDYKYINQAANAMISSGGTIIVEQGTHCIRPARLTTSSILKITLS